MSRFSPLQWHNQSTIWSYEVAVLCVGAALIIARWPVLHLQDAPVSLFLCAVILSAWIGGVWPGLLATALSVLTFYYYFLPPFHSLQAKPPETARLVLFAMSAFFVGSLSVAQRSATESLRRARDDLKLKIAELQQAEDRTRLIIDTVPAQLWTETPEGVVDFVNRRWVDYTGMTLEQAVGRGWTRILHPDDVERVLSKWRALIAEGKPREIESRLRRFDGEFRWFLSRCCPMVDRSGHILGWYGSDTDIHDRKKVEEALRRSEGYLAEAQRLSKTGSWARDPIADKILYWSDEMFRIFGQERQNGLPNSQRFAELVHPEDRDKLYEQIQKSVSEKMDYLVHHRIVLPDGTVKHIETIGHPVLNSGGEVVECVGTAMDVDRKSVV